MNSYGVFESKIIVNGQTIDNKNVLWEGKDQKANVLVNDNGKQNVIHLDKDDLLSLMKVPNINMPLEKRLERDLLSQNTNTNTNTSKKRTSKRRTTNKNRRTTNKKRRTTNKTRTSK